MPCEAWFLKFLARHVERHSQCPWPAYDQARVFYDSWQSVFDMNAITEVQAEQASVCLMADPPRYRGEHPMALLKLCAKALSSDGASGQASAKDEAAHASATCEECQGNGLAYRYRRNPQAKRASMLFYCRCPYGRWMLGIHRAQKCLVALDLAEYSWLWDDFRLPLGGPEVALEAAS